MPGPALSPAAPAAAPTPAPVRERRTFAALGTTIVLEGTSVERAAAEVLRLQALLTRFAPSPVTELNDRGALDDPPPELVAALTHALAVAERSDGLVTPLILPALRWAGYRRSWPDADPPEPGRPPAPADWRRVQVAADRIALPPGAALDLGGTGKSWIAERVAGLLGADALVDAGGDVLVQSADPIAVDVEAITGAATSQLLLPAGRWGIATSSVLGRAWPGAHHLIDPRTARPAEAAFVQATVVHASLCDAEVLTKLALLGALSAPPEGASLVLAQAADGAFWRLTPEGWIRA